METRIFDNYKAFLAGITEEEKQELRISVTDQRTRMDTVNFVSTIFDGGYTTFSSYLSKDNFLNTNRGGSFFNYVERLYNLESFFDMVLFHISSKSKFLIRENFSHWSFPDYEEEIKFRLDNELFESHILYLLLNKYFNRKKITSYEDRLTFLKKVFGFNVGISRNLFKQSETGIFYHKSYIKNKLCKTDKQARIVSCYGELESSLILSLKDAWFIPETTFAKLANHLIQEFPRFNNLSSVLAEMGNAVSAIFPIVAIDDYIITCKKCNNLSYKRSENSQILCEVCITVLLPTSKVINEYSTRAPKYLNYRTDKKDSLGNLESLRPNKETNYVFRGNTKVNEYFGVEIELESSVTPLKKEDEALCLYAAMAGETKQDQFILCKSDGSLNNGLEIVTCPATITVQKEKLKALFEAIKTTTLHSEKSCGLHIHVSRNAVSSLQLGKILEFINSKSNKVFIKDIAERDVHFAALDESITVTSVTPAGLEGISGDRYKAVNLSNRDTIEFRIFASTDNYENLMYKLEFLKALLDYTRTGQRGMISLKEISNISKFCEFVNENRKEYPTFYGFLTTKGWIIPRKKKPIPPGILLKQAQERV